MFWLLVYGSYRENIGSLKKREYPALNFKPIELILKIIPEFILIPKHLKSELIVLLEVTNSLVIFVAKSKPPLRKKE